MKISDFQSSPLPKDGMVFAVEGKVSLTKGLRRQADGIVYHADYVSVAIGTTPSASGKAWAERLGIGIFSVSTSGIVGEVVAAKKLESGNGYKRRLHDKAMGMPEGISGGVPNRLGVSAAYDVEAACRTYRETHPGATWDELFANIPNHYTSAASMRSSFYLNRQRRAFRARIKAHRAAKPEAHP